jgi:hypothetical protein
MDAAHSILLWLSDLLAARLWQAQGGMRQPKEAVQSMVELAG